MERTNPARRNNQEQTRKLIRKHISLSAGGPLSINNKSVKRTLPCDTTPHIRPPPFLHATTLSLPLHSPLSKHSPRRQVVAQQTTIAARAVLASQAMPPGSSKGVSPASAKRGRQPSRASQPRQPTANGAAACAQTDVCKSSCANRTSCGVVRGGLETRCEWVFRWSAVGQSMLVTGGMVWGEVQVPCPGGLGEGWRWAFVTDC